MRRVLSSTLIVALCVLPTELLAEEGWHIGHHDREGMPAEYYAAQIKVPVYTGGDKGREVKTHLTFMFFCSPESKLNSKGLRINLAFDEKPKFTRNVKRDPAAGINLYPVMLYFYTKEGKKSAAKYYQDMAYTSLLMVPADRNLSLTHKIVEPILKFDLLEIVFLMDWDGDYVYVKADVPMRHVAPWISELKSRCGMD